MLGQLRVESGLGGPCANGYRDDCGDGVEVPRAWSDGRKLKPLWASKNESELVMGEGNGKGRHPCALSSNALHDFYCGRCQDRPSAPIQISRYMVHLARLQGAIGCRLPA